MNSRAKQGNRVPPTVKAPRDHSVTSIQNILKILTNSLFPKDSAKEYVPQFRVLDRQGLGKTDHCLNGKRIKAARQARISLHFHCVLHSVKTTKWDR